MRKERCWVWFKGGLNDHGHWVGGFVATSSEAGGVLIQHGDYKDCRVPEWRISTDEPDDLAVAPLIPADAVWKLI